MGGWIPVAPAKAGFPADLGERLDRAIADKRLWNVHGVVVMRGERVVLGRYLRGPDNPHGRLLGRDQRG
jgi:hypothetical protein